jgi:rare lipoprotein A
MRFILPVLGAAAALSIGVSSAVAGHHQVDRHHHHHQAPKRVKSHVALHVSGHSVLAGEGVTVRGKVRPSGGHQVKLVVGGPEKRVIEVHTKADGTFKAKWNAEDIGNYDVTAYGIADRHTHASHSKVRHLTSFRYAGASYYGPGLYGNGVACGGTLEPGTLGVANKTLPCGTMVKLRYNGRSITVPVIDRGPYVAGRDYDLTEATKDRLGFPGVGTVLANH